MHSRRLLAASGDRRLVDQIRAGNDAAFEVAFDRYGPGILAFCHHMLGSREEGEDAVQHTFAAAYGDLLRDDREIALKAWLYTIARNRCVSLLRARREAPAERIELSNTCGPAEEAERREELRALLADMAQLPVGQREALLLTEAVGLSHAEVASVLGCEVRRVKALVYRARSGLIERRDARETPCERIREQLANLRGGSLRRNQLRHHLRGCPACRSFKAQLKQQRRMLAAALPIVPSVALKSSVLGATGLAQGSAGGGAALAALSGAGAAGPLGGATLAKVAIVGVIAAGGVAAERAVVGDGAAPASRPNAPVAQAPASSQPTSTLQATPPDAARPRPGMDHSPAGQRHIATDPQSSPPAQQPRSDNARVHGHSEARQPSRQTLAGGPGHTKQDRTTGHEPPTPSKARSRAHGPIPARRPAPRAQHGPPGDNANPPSGKNALPDSGQPEAAPQPPAATEPATKPPTDHVSDPGRPAHRPTK